MITKCLGELLHNHDCVVVPELGTFIAHECSAVVDYVNHRFTPPYKEIVFNCQLLNNDGLLVHYLAEMEDVTEAIAADEIHTFAMTSLGLLEAGQTVKLPGIGVLTKRNDEIFFHKDEDVNFLEDAFGLSSFSMQPIYRAETYRNIGVKIAAEQVEKQTPVNVDNVPLRRNQKWLIPATILVGAALVFFGLKKENNNPSLASIAPFSYPKSEQTEIIVETSENQKATENAVSINEPIKETSENQEATETAATTIDKPNEATTEILADEKIEIEAQSPIIEATIAANHYFIIGGSFNTAERAAVCLKQLKKQGFANAEILDGNENGKWRVAFEAYPTKSEAMPRLDAIKNEFNEQAWLLYQK